MPLSECPRTDRGRYETNHACECIHVVVERKSRHRLGDEQVLTRPGDQRTQEVSFRANSPRNICSSHGFVSAPDPRAHGAHYGACVFAWNAQPDRVIFLGRRRVLDLQDIDWNGGSC